MLNEVETWLIVGEEAPKPIGDRKSEDEEMEKEWDGRVHHTKVKHDREPFTRQEQSGHHNEWVGDRI